MLEEGLRDELISITNVAEGKVVSHRLLAYYHTAHMMRLNGTTARFLGAYLSASAQRVLEVETPVDWELQVVRILSTPSQNAVAYKGGTKYRRITDFIVGNGKKLPIPLGVVLAKTPIFSLETEKILCLVGVHQNRLTNVLVYSKATDTLLTTVPIAFSLPSGGGATVEDKVWVSFALDSKRRRILVYSAVEQSLAIDEIGIDSFTHNILFDSGSVELPWDQNEK